VKKAKTSTPAAVKVGGVAAAQVTPEKKVTVSEPPLVSSSTKAETVPLDATLATVKVVAPEIVLVK
jgi:hypothetical protein